jgi:tetratricopeptide (TPR) repeat protein
MRGRNLIKSLVKRLIAFGAGRPGMLPVLENGAGLLKARNEGLNQIASDEDIIQLFRTVLGRNPNATSIAGKRGKPSLVVLRSLLKSKEFKEQILPACLNWESLPQDKLSKSYSADQLKRLKSQSGLDDMIGEAIDNRGILYSMIMSDEGLESPMASSSSSALFEAASDPDFYRRLFMLCLGRKPGGNDDMRERSRSGVVGALDRLLGSSESKLNLVMALARGDTLPHRRFGPAPTNELYDAAELVSKVSDGDGLSPSAKQSWNALLLDFIAAPLVQARLTAGQARTAEARYFKAINSYLVDCRGKIILGETAKPQLVRPYVLNVLIKPRLLAADVTAEDIQISLRRGAKGKRIEVSDPEIEIGPQGAEITLDLSQSGLRRDDFVTVDLVVADTVISVMPSRMSVAEAEVDDILAKVRSNLSHGDEARAAQGLEMIELLAADFPNAQAELLDYYFRRNQHDAADAVIKRNRSVESAEYLSVLLACQRKLGRDADAVKTWDALLATGEADLESYVLAADVLQRSTDDWSWQMMQGSTSIDEYVQRDGPHLLAALRSSENGQLDIRFWEQCEATETGAALALSALNLFVRAFAPDKCGGELFERIVTSKLLMFGDVYDSLRAGTGLYRSIGILRILPALPIKSRTVRLNMARIIGASNRWAVALAYLKPLLVTDTSDSEILILAGNLYRKMGRWSDALDMFQAARKAGRDETTILHRIVEAERRLIAMDPTRPQLEYQDAITRLHSAAVRRVMDRPGNSDALLELAKTFVLRGEPDLALQILADSAERNPTHLASLAELARLAVDLKYNELAIRWARVYLETDFSQWVLISAVKALRAEGECEEAQDLLAKYFESGFELIRREFVRNLFFLGDFKKAAQEGERTIALQPEDLELRFLVSAAWLELGDLDRSSLHAYYAAAHGGWDEFPLETPLFLYATQQRAGLAGLGLKQLNQLFADMGCSDLRIRDHSDNSLFDRFEVDDRAGDSERETKDGVAPIYHGPLVSVVMTAYNAEEYVMTAARSILEQSYRNIELIIVDDCSTDGTPEMLLNLERNDPRVRVILKSTNDGTYVSKNMGLLQARGEFVALQDSDDWSHPDRIAKSVAALQARPELIGVTTDWIRMTTSGEIVIKAGGQIAHVCCISLVFRREPALKTLGFFDSVRIEADMEYIKRIALAFGDAAVARLRWPLLFGRARSDSLTASEEFGLTRTGYTMPRRNYQSAYGGWHSEIRTGGSPYMPFPLQDRRFSAPGVMLPVQIIDEVVDIVADNIEITEGESSPSSGAADSDNAVLEGTN